MTNGARRGARPQGKKGLPVIAWIAIGCGGLVVAGIAVFMIIGWLAVNKMKDVAEDFEGNPTKAAAELVVGMNPDLEMVSSDDDAGTLTIREKSSGKVVTVNYEDIRQGKITFESDEGTVELSGQAQGDQGFMTIKTDEGETRIGGGGDIPTWVPAHPATTTRQSLYQAEGPRGEMGHAAFAVGASVDEVVEFYRSELEGSGYEVTVTSFSSGDGNMSVVSGQKDGGGTIVASVGEKDGASAVTVQYNSGE